MFEICFTPILKELSHPGASLKIKAGLSSDNPTDVSCPVCLEEMRHA